jgi:hypothetical protein
MIGLWDVSIVEVVVEGLKFLIPLSGRHTDAAEEGQFDTQFHKNTKVIVFNDFETIHVP